jgi:Protein ENHANCED DISEASE RESISTANCE 2, C-terminal
MSDPDLLSGDEGSNIGAEFSNQDPVLELMTTVQSITNPTDASIDTAASVKKDDAKLPAMPTALVGSILGTRSESGTMVELKGIGSFEDIKTKMTDPEHRHSRSRAATAPSILASSVVDDGAPVGNGISGAEASTPASVLGDTSANTTEEEEDDEIKMAMAMALAIENNPHLTPAEIHELMGTTQPPPKPVAKPKSTASSMLSSLSMVTSISNTNTSTGKPMHNRFSQMFSSFAVNTTTAAAPGPSASKTSDADTMPSLLEESANVPPFTTAVTNTVAAVPTVASVPSDPPDAPPSIKSGVEETKTTPTVSLNPSAVTAQGKTAVAPTLSPSFTKQISHRTGNLFKSAYQRKNEAAITPTAGITPTHSAVPRLTGVAWKRRGGMGKYSTSAWERRRIELIGTKLMYFLMDENDMDMAAEDSIHPVPLPSDASHPLEGSTRGTRSFSADSGTTKEPRGFLDIAKEKATVNAAFGHSGAPTPFALSIKVRGETKWKLCFERHSTEMEWLAAISDIVIQSSVDAYNNSLLEAADPTNHSDFTLFHPPLSNKEAPSTAKGATAMMGTSTQHRLWMLEDYRVGTGGADELLGEDSKRTTLVGDSSDPRDGLLEPPPSNMDSSAPKSWAVVGSDMEDGMDQIRSEDAAVDVASPTEYATMLDPDLIQDTILAESNQAWIVPQSNLPHILTVVNLSLFYARSSATTMEGFWSLVVSANLGIFLCMAKQPSWQSILELVKAVKVTNQSPGSAIGNPAPRSMPLRSAVAASMPTATPIESVPSASAVDSVPKSGFIPEAGSTSVHLKETTDSPKNAKGEMFAGWCSVPGEILAVRSNGYAITKKKVPSPGELYECVQVEVFESPHRYPDMAKRVKLPKVEFDDDVTLKTWRCPDLFIISIALPTDSPRMGKTSSDGGGYTITMYYRMKAETRAILRRVTADGYDPSSEVIGEEDIQKSKVNAVRLLEEWVRRAPTDHKFQSRFKIVPNAHNLKEIGMPSWIAKYNGKPFLIKRPGVTGFLYTHPELSCVEFDVSLHPFPFLAKQAICYMKDSYFKKVLVSFGFVIEGRSDDEVSVLGDMFPIPVFPWIPHRSLPCLLVVCSYLNASLGCFSFVTQTLSMLSKLLISLMVRLPDLSRVICK